MHGSHPGCEMPADLPRARSAQWWGSNPATDLRNRRLVIFSGVALLALMAATLFWLPFSTVDSNGNLGEAAILLPSVFLLAVLEAIRWRLRKAPFRHREVWRDFARRIQVLVVALSSILFFSTWLLLFSYMATATTQPLMDMYLASGDAALGFNWTAYVGWLDSHYLIASILSKAYFSLSFQLPLLPAMLALIARPDRVAEMIAQFELAGCLTCLIMLVVPAAGAFDFYHPSPDLLSSFGAGASTRHLEQLHALRTLKPFLIEHPEGLVTFPSFHAALAVIFAYSVRGIRFVAVPVYLLNALLILATPAEGSHYLVDVLAGVLVAVAAIQTVRWIGGTRALNR